MSRSGNRCTAVVVALAAVAACSAPDPRPVDVAEPAVVEPEVVGSEVVGSEVVEPIASDTQGVVMPPVEVPEEAQLQFERALAAMRQGDWLNAGLELEELIFAYPLLPGPHVNLAIVHRQEGRTEEAEASLMQALGIAPDHAVAHSELGIIYRERGEFAAAEAAYRRAIAADPAYALAHYNLGVLLDLYLKRESEALEHYEAYQSLAPEPDQEVGRWIVDLRRRLGIPAEPQQVAQETGP